MPRYYPLFLSIAGRTAVVVGGGAVAARRVRLLIECGAEARVISPSFSAEFDPLKGCPGLTFIRRPYRADDLQDAILALASTDDAAVNQSVAQDARLRGVLVNVADEPTLCDFVVPSLVRRGDLTVAISTGGASPALAKRLREDLEQTIGPEYEEFLKLLKETRRRVQEEERDPERRRAIFERLVASDLLERLRRGDRAGAAAKLEALLRD